MLRFSDLIPRFVTKDVAIRVNELGEPDDFKLYSHVVEGDEYDCIGKIKYFNLFGFCVSPKIVMEEVIPIYRHKRTGKHYYLVCLSNLKSNTDKFIPTAVYTDDEGNTWSRPMSEFFDKCERI